jgi:hypothetical protein
MAPYALGTVRVSGKALAAGIAANLIDQKPAASAVPLTYLSNDAYLPARPRKAVLRKKDPQHRTREVGTPRPTMPKKLGDGSDGPSIRLPIMRSFG